MVRSNSQTTAIFDAGPIIHLDELSSLILISDFYPIIISETVQKEIINLLNRIPKETTLFIKSSLLEEIIQKIRGE